MRLLLLVTAGTIAPFLLLTAATAEDDPPALLPAVRGQNANGSPAAGADAAAASEAGYLGVKADDRGPGDGVRIEEAIAGGPAEAAGLRAGDLVTAVQGQTVRSLEEFAARMRPFAPDARIVLTVLRGDEKLAIDATLGRRPGAPRTPQLRLGPALPAAPAAGAAPLGLRVQPVTEQAAQRFGLPAPRGAQVTMVAPDTAADRAGLAVDAVIVSIDGRAVESPDDAARMIGAARAGETLKFALYERGRLVERDVTVAATTTDAAGASDAAAAAGGTTDAAVIGAPAAAPGAGGSENQPGGGARNFAETEKTIEEARARVKQLEKQLTEMESQLGKLQRDMQKLVDDLNSERQNTRTRKGE